MLTVYCEIILLLNETYLLTSILCVCACVLESCTMFSEFDQSYARDIFEMERQKGELVFCVLSLISIAVSYAIVQSWIGIQLMLLDSIAIVTRLIGSSIQ